METDQEEMAIYIPGQGSYIIFDGEGEELVAGEVNRVIEKFCGIAQPIQSVLDRQNTLDFCYYDRDLEVNSDQEA